MPTPIYMSIEGESQGLITKGAMSEQSVGMAHQENMKDFVDTSIVQEVDHTVLLPRDPQSGQPTGQRVHQAFAVTKVLDRASPLLMQALVTAENLTVTLKWYRPSKLGGLEHYYTTTLEKAIVVDIKTYMPHCQDKNNADFTHLERVQFSYKDIRWEHVVATTEAQDSWENIKIT